MAREISNPHSYPVDPSALTLTYQYSNYSNNYVHDRTQDSQHHTQAKTTVICSKHLSTNCICGKLLISAIGYFIALEAVCLMIIWNITKVILKKMALKIITLTMHESIWKLF